MKIGDPMISVLCQRDKTIIKKLSEKVLGVAISEFPDARGWPVLKDMPFADAFSILYLLLALLIIAERYTFFFIRNEY